MDNKQNILKFADRMGQYQAQRHGLPPVTGRVVGYLSVCDPMEQSINDIAEALLTSRSAVNNAIAMLETQKLIKRTRPAGSRSDLVSLGQIGMESGFDPAEYRELAEIAREGLELLKDATPERRQALETTASLGEFLADRLPKLYQEWEQHYKNAITKK